jgi:ribose 5-phosphate isomerase A
MTVIPLTAASELDLAVDGADAVGTEGVLIKGGGAALVRERLIIASARQRLILVDATKSIGPLQNVTVPIAVVPFGWTYVLAQLQEVAAQVTLRVVDAKPVITDDGLYVLDAQFAKLMDPLRMHQSVKQIAGVVDTGIFAGYNPEIWVGDGAAEWALATPNGS